MPERVRLCCSEAASPSACWVCLCLSPTHVPLPACPASRATAEAGGWSAWSATGMWQKTVRSSYVPRRTKRRDGVMCSLHATALRLSRMSYVIRERVDCGTCVLCVCDCVSHRPSRIAGSGYTSPQSTVHSAPMSTVTCELTFHGRWVCSGQEVENKFLSHTTSTTLVHRGTHTSSSSTCHD